MPPISSTSMSAVLKTLFPSGRVKEQLYKRSPTLGILKKDPTFSGESLTIPIVYESTNGASATFSTAQNNKDTSSMVKFVITTVEDYSLVSVTRKVMLQTRNDKGARLKAIEHAHKMALYTAGRSISHGLFRDGEGVLGQISATSNVGTTVITLAEPSDVVHFRKGMKLVASAAVGGALRNAGATVTVAAVNRSNGQITATGNWSAGIAAVAAGDYLYREGDARNNGTSRLKMTGLLGWMPLAGPVAAESFFGVDRSVDPTRLAGFISDKSSLPFEEALIEAQSEINVESLGIDTMICNNKVKRLAQKALGSKVQYAKRPAMDEKGPMGSIGFETIRLEGDKGPIDLIADPDCPHLNPSDSTKALAFFLRSGSWTLYSMLDAPHIFDEGSAQQDLRESSADAYEGRVGAYLQLGPTEDDAGPGDSGVAQLPTS
jgi:hypothetical protein